MGFTNLNFKKSKFRIQFYQNPRFRDKILTIQSLKIPCDPYKIHTQSNFHTKFKVPYLGLLELLFFLFFFFFFFFSPSLFSLYGLVSQNLRPNLLLLNCLVKAMFGLCIFKLFFSFLQFSPSIHSNLYFIFLKFHISI